MAGNGRFHDKNHKYNHHTLSSVGFADSATDPIASPEHPFKGSFVVNGPLSSNSSVTFLSANILGDAHVQNLYADNRVVTNYISGYDSEAVFSDTIVAGHGANTITFAYTSGAYFSNDINVAGNIIIGGSISIVGNVSAYGDLSYINTDVVTTSALSVNNLGQSTGLTINQNFAVAPIARFESANTVVLEVSSQGATLNGTLSTNKNIVSPNLVTLQGVSSQYVGLSTNFQNAYTSVTTNSANWNIAYSQLSSGILSSAGGVGMSVQVSLSTISFSATTGLFNTSVSAGSVSGIHFGDGSKLTGLNPNGQIAYSLLTGGNIVGNLTAPAGYYITTILSSASISANTLSAYNVTVFNSISAPAISGVHYGDGSRLIGLNPNGQAAYALLTGGVVNGNLNAPAGYYITTILSSASVSANTLSAYNATFFNSISAPAISGVHYGDGSRLTGVASSNPNGQAAYALLTGGVTIGNLNAAAGYYITTILSSASISANTLSAYNVTIFNSISAPAISGVHYGDGSRLTGVAATNPNGQAAYALLTGGVTNGNLNAAAGYYITTILSSASISANTLSAYNATFFNSVSSPAISSSFFYGDGSRLINIAGTSTTAQNTVSSLSSRWNSYSINFLIDDGTGLTIGSGVKGRYQIPTNSIVLSAFIIGDQTGDIVIDVLSSSYASYPNTASITGVNRPLIFNSTKNNLTTVGSWLSVLSANDFLTFNVISATNITSALLTINLIKI